MMMEIVLTGYALPALDITVQLILLGFILRSCLVLILAEGFLSLQYCQFIDYTA
jgi:hypothetical protein